MDSQHAIGIIIIISVNIVSHLHATVMYSILQSHSFHEAHWNGTCGLSPEQQAAHMLRKFVQPNEDELTEALEDLQTN